MHERIRERIKKVLIEDSDISADVALDIFRKIGDHGIMSERDMTLTSQLATKAIEDIARKAQRTDESFEAAFDRVLQTDPEAQTFYQMGVEAGISQQHEDAAVDVVKAQAAESELNKRVEAYAKERNIPMSEAFVKYLETPIGKALYDKTIVKNPDQFAGLNPMHKPTVANVEDKKKAKEAEAEIERQVALLMSAEDLSEPEAYSRFLETSTGKKLYAIAFG
jgi:predicted metal-dependent hydrolase